MRKTLAVLAALVGLSLAAAACSGSGSSGGGSPEPTAGTKTYTNSDYGFSITYDTIFAEGESTNGSTSGSNSVFDVAFADTEGTKLGGSYVDGIQVSVYKLARSVKPSEVPSLKKEFKLLVAQMMGGLEGGTVAEPLRLAQINGTPGYRLAYTYTQDSTPIAAITYFLVKGQYEYQVTGQASQKSWDALSPKLEAAVKSFTIE